MGVVSMKVKMAVVAGLAVATSGFLFATPASADPKGEVGVANAPCGKNAPDKDAGSWGATAKTAANQRSGSSLSCGIDGVLQTSDRADYHCYTRQNAQYTWTFLRNVRTNVSGWVRDDLLEDGGSIEYCGF